MVIDHPILLNQLVDELLYRKQFDEAKSIANRHNLVHIKIQEESSPSKN